MHLCLMLDAFNPILATAVLEAKDLPPLVMFSLLFPCVGKLKIAGIMQAVSRALESYYQRRQLGAANSGGCLSEPVSTCQSREPGHGQQPAWSYRRGSTRTTRRHSKTWCDPHRNADRTGNLGKLEAGRAKHMVTHILRRFTRETYTFRTSPY
jgi:hypothetical protein